MTPPVGSGDKTTGIPNAFNAAAFPFSVASSGGLRAAGDVRYTMAASLVSTIAGRLLFSWILGVALGMGVIGIALAMVIDWTARAVLFILRARSSKRKEFQVI